MSAWKNQPSGSTFGGLVFHFSRAAASESKIAQIGPPPLSLVLSPCQAIAALKNLNEPSASFQNRLPYWLTMIRFCQSFTVSPVALACGNMMLSVS